MTELKKIRELMDQGRWQEARDACQALDASRQSTAEVLSLNGMIHGQLGDLDEARRCFQRLTELKPQSYAAFNNLGLVLVQLKRHDDALRAYQKALELKADFVEAWFNLGRLMTVMGRYEAALKSFNRVLDIRPESVEAVANAGVVLFILGRYGEATTCLEKALRDKPENRDWRFYLGQSLLRQGHFDRALAIFNELIAADPDDPRFYHARGNVYVESRRPELALASYQQALDVNPGYGNVYFDLGVAYQSTGDLSRANEAHRQAIAFDPVNVRAWRSLANNRKFTDADDPELRAMLDLLTNPRLSDEERMYMHFALGKVYEDLKDDDRSFTHYRHANRLMRSHLDYSLEADRRYFQQMQQSFNNTLLSTHGGRQQRAHDQFVPIFIVGMPRSGTTLTEQILASHADVHGAGELSALSDVLSDFHGVDGLTKLTELDQSGFDELARRYRQLVQQTVSTDRRYVVDKMPHNFRFIGFIRLMFPQAKVIHCLRDPVDTCLSCYKRYFAGGGVRFAYDLTELGQYYCLYLGLMDHWHSVLPGYVYDLRYEDLIADQEGQTRRLLEFCGLPWDERCLAFYDSHRTVTTNSYNQVRQPIYQSSVQSWRRFEDHLAPLLNELRHCQNGYSI